MPCIQERPYQPQIHWLISTSIKTNEAKIKFTVEESIGIMKALADSSRLLIINSLYEKSHYVEELSERLKENTKPDFDEAEALSGLEKRWLEKIRPFGDRGYNQPKG